nr:immunoglobulin light chain junction region [Macaca mulatta]MOW08105.1 immunoglobulin light chain junction region [Macaca mulatta]MOW08230.1 immunoglobulin light chain junction region [Macaca mulatta]MOW09090.1 immunoglobulin light chain junction region [Macaca mulatta]MOW09151.1 immunoglobulin light chain junction region [Macaca mulatta]
CMQSTELWTF